MILTKEEIGQWKMKRRFTLLAFCIQYFVNGMVYHLLLSTCWAYINSQLKPDKPSLVYSVMIYLMFLPTLMFSLLLTHLQDQQKRTKLCLISLNFACLIGYMCYTMSFSIYFPIIGCFLMGFRSLMDPVMIGELARSYHPDELTYTLPITNFMLFFAVLPSALIVFLTPNIKLNIGSLYITYGNFIGIVMIILYCVKEIVTVTFVSDLSREYNLKESLANLKKTGNTNDNNKDTVLLEPNDETDLETAKEFKSAEKYLSLTDAFQANDNKRTFLLNLKRIANSYDVLLMYFLVFLFYYVAYFTFSYLPLLIQAELKYSIQVYNIICLGFAFLLSIFLPIIMLVKVQSRTAYFIGLICFTLILGVGFCLYLISLERDEIFNISLLSVIGILTALYVTGEDIFLTCSIAKFVKSDIQTFADGIRVMFRAGGAAAGSFSSGFFGAYKDIFLLVLLTLLLLAIFLMVRRRSTLMNPKTTI